MKLVRLIKICVNDTNSEVLVGKHLFDVYIIKIGLKQGDALSPLLFTFALKCTIRRVQVKQDGLKLNGTLQFLFCADDDDIWDGSVRTLTFRHRASSI